MKPNPNLLAWVRRVYNPLARISWLLPSACAVECHLAGLHVLAASFWVGLVCETLSRAGRSLTNAEIERELSKVHARLTAAIDQAHARARDGEA